MINQRELAGSESTIDIQRGSLHSIAEPPIKLENNICTYKKEKCVNIKCQTNPADSTSTTYLFTIPSFKKGNSEEWLEWTTNVKRAVIGQNATTTGADKYALARRLLEDGALQAFDNAARWECDMLDGKQYQWDYVTVRTFSKRKWMNSLQS